ncbi:MAG: hypothetical protein IJU40_01225, partial [Desulfovibrionaceae bacterium]|nr:hypothetical protein [Desulfovibrionaceae bacterium]
WYPFSDHAGHLPVILAQADCAEQESRILVKQINVKRWENKLRGLVALPCTVSPLCYRTSTNRWPGESNITSIFLDRLRVLTLICKDTAFDISSLQSLAKIKHFFPVESS